MTYRDEKGVLHVRCSGESDVIRTNGMDTDQLMGLIGKLGGVVNDDIRSVVAATLERRKQNDSPVAEICQGCELCRNLPDAKEELFS